MRLNLPDFTRSNTEGQLEVIWEVLHTAHEELGIEDEQWDEITTAMSFITEDLGVDVDFYSEKEN